MKVFAGGINTETNTFSPVPTGLSDFVVGRIDNESRSCESEILQAVGRLAEQQGWIYHPSFIAVAVPGGITTATAYKTLKELLLKELEQAMPVDMVFLHLHGAMVATDCSDCEGDIISAVRTVVGAKVPIGVELDLHCHLTQAMLNESDVIAIYREYPHTDIIERAEALFLMLADIVRGKTRPVMAMYDCRMVNLYPTALQPMRQIVDSLEQYESRPEVISANIGHGFPWGDVKDCGTRTLVITDNDPHLAQELACKLGEDIYRHRHELLLRPLGLDEALNRAAIFPHTGKPLVLADQSDNPGCGAAGDSTFALAAMLERKVAAAAVGMIWDPQVVEIAKRAGEGATLNVRLGGKATSGSGIPLDLEVQVVGIKENLIQLFPQNRSEAVPALCGDTVCLESDGIFIIVNSTRSQVFNPSIFTTFGLKLEQLKLLVVKSTFHFYAAFESVAEQIILMAAPGPLNTRFQEIPYQHADLHKYPWVDDPF
ncbi:M81 family metallopeptidase [Spongorhabdus nitratireducens]